MERGSEHVVTRNPIPADAYDLYAGRWIAVDDAGEVVAVADTLEQLWSDERLMTEATAVRVPEPGIHLF